MAPDVRGVADAGLTTLRSTFLLREGEPQTFQLKFKRAEDYPIDLYYLMDLSFSMKDDLENVKNLGTALMKEMQKITSDFRIGEESCSVPQALGCWTWELILMSSPVRVWLVCGEDGHAVHQHHPCQAPQPLHGQPELHQPLQLQERPEAHKQGRRVQPPGEPAADLREPGLSGGRLRRHHAGGGLRGKTSPRLFLCLWLLVRLLTTACSPVQEQIGWRNVTRLLVFSTDAGFHFAGDGKLGGIVLPNDGKCHLDNNMYTMSHYFVCPPS